MRLFCSKFTPHPAELCIHEAILQQIHPAQEEKSAEMVEILTDRL